MKQVLIFLVLFALPVLAEPTHDDLRRLESRIREEKQVERENQRKAAEISDEVNSVQKQMIQLAQSIQEKEAMLTALEEKQTQTRARQKELEERLALSEGQMVKLVSGMQTLALRPSELVLFDKGTPIRFLRSRMMMQYSLPVVNGTNRQFRRDLSELSRVRETIQEQITQIKATRAQLADRSDQMDKLLQQKSLLHAQYKVSQSQAQERAQALALEARDLKDLLTRLEAERRRQAELKRQEQMRVTQAAVQKMGQAKPSFRLPESGSTLLTAKEGVLTGFDKAYGKLVWPIKGIITEQFGVETASGAHTKGLTLSGRAKAQVVAPFDGTVLFAGPFKSYGQLLIIDNGDNYLMLLAGMEKINPVVGQEVLAGEPIGQMREMRPELYLEIRKDGQPVNPAPWFTRS